ncbi:MAG: adenylosuccinate lyase [Thermoplasmata archaeon]
MTGPTDDLLCPLEYRYGRPQFRALFTRKARLERALRVEAALAAAQASLGAIPSSDAEGIGRAVSSGKVTLERVDALERELRHDVMAIVRALSEAAGDAGAWVHYGATSADITETALGLELKEALQVLRVDLTDLASALVDLARRYEDTPAVGRTHGQHAVPLSFGYKMASGAAEVLRHRVRLDELAPRLAVGKMAGAVGTGAGFGVHAEKLESDVMARLGLLADEAPTQIVGRDRLAELTNFLALVAGTAERLATEVRNLQRPEIAEAAEPFDEAHQVGSSTMAQKRNPVVTENVTSLARLIRAFSLPPLENMALWHERDLAQSANERIVIPHALVLSDDVLTKLTQVFRGLRVDVNQLAHNLELSSGAVMTESLLLALTARGVPRGDAHELLRQLTREEGSGLPLADRARADARVTQYLTARQIDELLDPARYVQAAAEKTGRVLRRLEPQLKT